MRSFLLILLFSGFILTGLEVFPQDRPVYPNVIKIPVAFEITGALRDNPIVTETDLEAAEFYMNAHRDREINPNISPPDFDNMPPDPGVQTNPGLKQGSKAILQDFSGQVSPYYPPDANGAVGADYYFQVVNVTYAIYDKSDGSIAAGPSPLNSIFNSSLPGAGCNSGDPIVLWDEHADRWFFAEFSLCLSNDYMLIAVSKTNDPTGEWYSWSYDVDDMPDYMKFGVWQDGYYMATNTSGGNDVYVFDRTTMLAGGASPTMIGFDNAWRPVTFDGFHCILPLDNDGPWAPADSPGQFITIVDDGQGNPADQLWIYELVTDWATPTSSTFTRTQTLGVNAFSGNFNNSWNNIPQLGTAQTLDGLSTILMYRAQYRNFSGTERLVCAHAIAESANEAALRWYELENTGSGWSIRQQSTYNPDDVSRWNMSIALNGDQEIGIGYSVSNALLNPGIRYVGQSSGANIAANNTLDMAETTVFTGNYSQTGYNRWGDYSNISVDPTDDHTFWYTNEYMAVSTHGTHIVSFQFSEPSGPPIANFVADNIFPLDATVTVNFSDLSTKTPTSWAWLFNPSTITFVDGTSASSQNPKVQFDGPGVYSVSLTSTNEFGSGSETKTDYIHMGQPGLWTGATDSEWSTAANWANYIVPDAITNITISTATNWPVFNGDLLLGTTCGNIAMAGASELSILGNLTIPEGFELSVTGNSLIAVEGNWTNAGLFAPGTGTVLFNGTSNGSINDPASLTDFLINEDFSVWPGNWNGSIGTGTSQFNQSASSIAGGVSPEVKFTGANLNAGTAGTRRIYYDPVNTTNYSSMDLSFIHSVVHGKDGYSLNLEYSTDGTNWTSIWTTSPTANITTQIITLALTGSEGVGAENYYLAFSVQDSYLRLNAWYIDDLLLISSLPVNGEETYNNLTIGKSSAGIITNGDITVNNDLTVNSGAYFTNAMDNNLVVQGDFLLEADETSMASFIDNGTTTVIGDAIVEQYLAYDAGLGYQHHLVSAPISNATLNSYYNLYFYAYDEAGTDGSYWDNIFDPLDFPLTVGKGFTVTGSPGYTGATTVVFNTGPGGMLNNSDVTYSDFTRDCADLNYIGFELVGNPFQSALEWNSEWNLVGLSGWMLVWDKDTYRGYHADGTAYQSGTPYIPPTQGFFVRANTLPASITIPASERVHNSQSFYKQTGDYPHPILRLEAASNEHTDECVVVFHPEGHWGFDGYYDLSKFANASSSPKLYTVSDKISYGFNVLPPDYLDAVIPLNFEIPAPGIYQLEATAISNFADNINIYLEDLKEGSVSELKTNPHYEFSYHPLDDPHRFNLHFKESFVETQVIGGSDIRAYAFGSRVYVHTPAHQPGKISVYDLLGREILAADALKEGYTVLELTNGTGYYLVRVQTNQESLGKKVFISQ